MNTSNEVKSLYEGLDENKLRRDAEAHLFEYGSTFVKPIIAGAHGLDLITTTGDKLMDWTSGQMSCLLGHGNPEIVDVIHQHAVSLDHLYSGMISPPVIKLAKALADVLPPGLDKAMFLSTGGESNECAIKLAKASTGKFELVGLSASWHGSTSGAAGVQYKAERKGTGPVMPGMHMLPAPDSYRSIFRHPDGAYDWESELDYGWSLIDTASCGSLAAVIIEPILSSGGMLTLPTGYLHRLKEHCKARDMVLIVDEAQTAIGRCGDLFAIDHEQVVPDILTLSKTLGNGLPLSAVVTSDAIASSALDKGFMFYTTHANDPLPAAVGLKVLEIVLRDDRALIKRAAIAGQKLHKGLNLLKSRYSCIGEIRGRGLMAGIEIVKDRRISKDAAIELGQRLSDKIMEMGLFATISATSFFSGCFRIAPPIVITDEQLTRGLAILEAAFNQTEGTGPLFS